MISAVTYGNRKVMKAEKGFCPRQKLIMWEKLQKEFVLFAKTALRNQFCCYSRAKVMCGNVIRVPAIWIVHFPFDTHSYVTLSMFRRNWLSHHC
jgi:hypothetical protein